MVIATCPIIVYMLNGTLYVDPKVLIPFLPLGMLLFGHTYFDIIRGKLKLKPLAVITLLVALAGVFWFKTTKKWSFILSLTLLCLCRACLYTDVAKKNSYLI